MAWRRWGGSRGSRVTVAAGLISPETGQTFWVTEATTDRSCAKLENSCHDVTCGQGGSGSEGTNQKGKSLSNLSSHLPTPCCHCFWSVCIPGHVSKILGSSPVQHRLPVMLPRSLPCHLPRHWAQPAKRSLLQRLGGVRRSAAELPRPAVPSPSQAGSHHSCCKNSLSKTTSWTTNWYFLHQVMWCNVQI